MNRLSNSACWGVPWHAVALSPVAARTQGAGRRNVMVSSQLRQGPDAGVNSSVGLKYWIMLALGTRRNRHPRAQPRLWATQHTPSSTTAAGQRLTAQPYVTQAAGCWMSNTPPTIPGPCKCPTPYAGASGVPDASPDKWRMIVPSPLLRSRMASPRIVNCAKVVLPVLRPAKILLPGGLLRGLGMPAAVAWKRRFEMSNRVVSKFFVLAALIWPCVVFAQCPPDQVILNGASLGGGIGLGLNTSNNRADWLSNDGTELIMQYPAGQAWGSVFLTVGTAVPPGNRPGRDMSACQNLVLEMMGDQGTVNVGIKDTSQPDNGTEPTVPVQISGQWQTYTIPLSRLSPPTNLKAVYVLAELNFSGPQTQNLRVRSIVYTSASSAPPAKVLPHFVFGGGWYSALYFTNTTTNPASVRLSFLADDGSPLNVPSVGGSSMIINLGSRATTLVEAPNTGNLVEGYVSALLPDTVTGYGVFRWAVQGQPDQEAVVPFSGSTSTTSTLIWDDKNLVTAVAIVNPSALATSVSITLRDMSGQNIIGTSSVALPPHGHTAAVLRNLAGLAGMAGQRGSADFVVSSGNVAVLGLRANGTALTSIPTTDR